MATRATVGNAERRRWGRRRAEKSYSGKGGGDSSGEASHEDGGYVDEDGVRSSEQLSSVERRRRGDGDAEVERREVETPPPSWTRERVPLYFVVWAEVPVACGPMRRWVGNDSVTVVATLRLNSS